MKDLESRLGELLAGLPPERLDAFEKYCEQQEQRETRKNTKGTGAMAETLRKAIQESGLSLYRVAKESAVPYATLHRFVAGERAISLDAFERLCGLVGLGLVSKGKPMGLKPT